MDSQTPVNPDTEVLGRAQNASPKYAGPKAKRSAAKRVATTVNNSANTEKGADRPAHTREGASQKANTRSKKAQLIAMLSKPNGARLAVLVERLGWQSHTVRAALSGLRKQGLEVSTAKSAKGVETVYAIIAGPATDAGDKPQHDG